MIPVLVDGASIPKSRDLPDELNAFVRRHALEVRHARFKDDRLEIFSLACFARRQEVRLTHQSQQVFTGRLGGRRSATSLDLAGIHQKGFGLRSFLICSDRRNGH